MQFPDIFSSPLAIAEYGILDLVLLGISWQEHHTNDSILTELGLERELMGRVAKLKLQYSDHITRGSAKQLALTVLEGIMEGLRHQGRPRRQADTRH